MNSSVPILNLKAQYETIQTEMEETILGVLRSGNYILGKYVSTLEEKIAEISGAKYGIGVANGTDALLLALWAINVGPGDEVITTPFTFAATVEAIALRGAKPVFVDIDEKSFNIDPTLIEAAITPRTKAIMPVHLYGLPSNMEPICAVAKKHGLYVIEDNAQGIGAMYRGQATGSMGDLACTSFYPTKNLGAAGDAGMIVTSNEKLAERLKAIRAHGMRKRYYHDELGVNSRLDELQAATLMVKVPHLAKWNKRRAEIAAMYTKGLDSAQSIVTPTVSLAGVPQEQAEKEVEHVYHQYTIRVVSDERANGLENPRRDEMVKGLADAGIGSMCYYPVPLHVQEAFSQYGYKMGDFPISERLSREVLSLPMYPELTNEQVAYVASTICQLAAKDGLTSFAPEAQDAEAAFAQPQSTGVAR